MIALESMKRVDVNAASFVPSKEWNWEPKISEPGRIDKTFIEASGGMTTSRDTFTSQMDHGENY